MAQATSSNTQDLGTYAFIIGINQVRHLPLDGVREAYIYIVSDG
jgi:hypothetical protein